MKPVIALAILATILIALAIVVWSWQFTVTKQANLAVLGSTENRELAEEYRRLTELAITAQEHTDLKLGEVALRLDQLRDQLDSVQRILKDVE